MKILILGSEGFIGSHLVRHFQSKYWEVSGCDLYEQPSFSYSYYKISKMPGQFKDIFNEGRYDACINASGSGNVNQSVLFPLRDFELNTFDTARILDAIRKNNRDCKYLHISSAAVYGNPEVLPVSETALTAPLSPYGWHKLMSELLCKEYHILYGISIAITRPFSIYGPGLKKQIFWDLFQKYKENKAVVELWGNGEESRDFIYIDDVIDSLELILAKAPMQAETYNIASGNETMIEDVVKMFFENIPAGTKIIFNNKSREGDPKNWKADITKIKELGFIPGTNLATGIHNVAAWLLQTV